MFPAEKRNISSLSLKRWCFCVFGVSPFARAFRTFSILGARWILATTLNEPVGLRMKTGI